MNSIIEIRKIIINRCKQQFEITKDKYWINLLYDILKIVGVCNNTRQIKIALLYKVLDCHILQFDEFKELLNKELIDFQIYTDVLALTPDNNISINKRINYINKIIEICSIDALYVKQFDLEYTMIDNNLDSRNLFGYNEIKTVIKQQENKKKEKDM